MNPESTSPSHRAALWLGGVFLFCFIYFLPWVGDWNQNVRLDLTLALVNHAGIRIDQYHWNTGDAVRYRGHYYVDKSPGLSFAGVPVALAYKGLLAATGNGNVSGQIGLKRPFRHYFGDFFLLQYLESIFTVALPAVALLLLFFGFLGRYSGSTAHRALLTICLGLVTMIFPYSRVFYGHVPVAALLFLAFFIVFTVAQPPAEPGRLASLIARRPKTFLAFAGFSAGMAVFVEYPAILITGILTIYALILLRRDQRLAFLGGLLPAAAVVMLYDVAAYGNPFVTGYTVPSSIWKQQGRGIAGTGFHLLPEWDAISGMFVSPYRGLFYVSPLLLLALPGYVLWYRRRSREFWLFLAIPLAYYIFIAMFPYWFGGSAVGPRYLIPMLPFLMTPIIFVLDRANPWLWTLVALLTAASLFNVWIQTVGGNGYPAPTISNPLFQHSLPLVTRPDITPSIGTILLFPFGAGRSLLTLLPLVAVIGVWSAVLGLRAWRQATRQPASSPPPRSEVAAG